MFFKVSLNDRDPQNLAQVSGGKMEQKRKGQNMIPMRMVSQKLNSLRSN
jgi:hypothetical protein